MRTTQLRAAIRAYAEQAAPVLAAATADGDEVGFEVVEQRGRGRRTPLYCYRPLTAEFVNRHAVGLAGLETHVPALHALASLEGLDAYLQARGVAHPPATERDAAELALRLFIAHAYEDAEPEFEFSDERFERAFSALERAVADEPCDTVAVALLRGLALRSPEVVLADGLTLMQPEAFDALPPVSGWPAIGDGPIPSTLVILDAKHGGGGVPERLRNLLTALRLFSPGVALEPLAWVRLEQTAWRPLPLDVRGRARGAIVVAPEQEDELRAFCSLISRRASRESTIGWAQRRFELGCESDDRLVGLTDFLLALRALLEPEGPRSGRLAARLAALCALPGEREPLAERIAHTISLERSAVAGLAPRDRGAERLVDELAGYLRALLRDVLCGHLDSELVAVADGLLEQQDGDALEEAPSFGSPSEADPVRLDSDDDGEELDAIPELGETAEFEALDAVTIGAAPDPGDDVDMPAGDWPAADLRDGRLFS